MRTDRRWKAVHAAVVDNMPVLLGAALAVGLFLAAYLTFSR